METLERCPCCKSYEDCPYFPNMVNIKNAGLIIYRYSNCKRNETNQTKKTGSFPEVLILHNTKNYDIASDKLIPKLGQYKKCPRCKYILEHAEKLLHNVPTIKKLEIFGICDRCQTKDRKVRSYCECSKAIAKFIETKEYKIREATRSEQKQSKQQELLNRFIKKDKSYYDKNSLDPNLDNTCHVSSRIHEPEIDDLVKPKIESRGTNVTATQQERVRFSKIAHKIQLSHKNYSDSELEFEIKNTKKGKEYLLRQLRSLDDKEPSSIDTIDEHNNGTKYVYEEAFDFNVRDNSRKPTSISNSLNLHSDGVVKTQIIKEPLSDSDDDFRFPELLDTKDLLHEDFSYYFIKESTQNKNCIQKTKSSAELIKDTQDMLITRENKLKIIYEEKLKFRTESKQVRNKNKMVLVENEIKASDKRKMSQPTKTISTENKYANVPFTSITEIQPNLDKSEVKQAKKPQINYETQVNEENSKLGRMLTIKGKEKLNRYKDQSGEEKGKPEKETSKDKKKYEVSMELPQRQQELREQPRTDKENNENGKELSEKYKETHTKRSEQVSMKDKKSPEKDEKLYSAKQETRENGRIEKYDQLKKKNIEEKISVTKQKELLVEKHKKKKVFSAENKKAREDAAEKLTSYRKLENDAISKPETPKHEGKIEQPKLKELNITQINIKKSSREDLISQIVQMKQTDAADKKVEKISYSHSKVRLFADHKQSELEIDLEESTLKKPKSIDISDIIIGQKVCKYKLQLVEKSEANQKVPLFLSSFNDDFVNVSNKNAEDIHISEQLEPKLPKRPINYTEQELPKGVIRYALSDRTFIDKGWTMLPTEKVVRKMNVYRMRPSHPEFDWFEHNKSKRIIQYDTGEKLADFDNNGRGRLYYRSGRLALDYYNAEEINAQQRIVIHSSGELDARGRSWPLAILATFDYLGNGIVFDHTGKIRLKYNQTEGVVLDRSIGPVSHWKWHTLNDPPVLQQVMIDTQIAHKDPDILKLGGPVDNIPRTDNEEMLAIEFDNFIKEKSKKLSQKFKPFQIKMKALKINEYFSLRVLDQATIYLIFRHGSTTIKLNLGMILDHQEIVDTDTAQVGEVSNSLEKFPARTDSLAGLQNSIAYAERAERARVERERRIRPPQPPCSSDKLIATISRPLRAPLHNVPQSTVAICKCIKPSSNNLYYDTRLV